MMTMIMMTAFRLDDSKSLGHGHVVTVAPPPAPSRRKTKAPAHQAMGGALLLRSHELHVRQERVARVLEVVLESRQAGLEKPRLVRYCQKW